MPSAAASRLLPPTTPLLTESNFIGKWMSQIAPAADAIQTPKADWDALSAPAGIRLGGTVSFKNLMTFPFVQAAVERANWRSMAPDFGVASGKLLIRNEATGAASRRAARPPPRRSSADAARTRSPPRRPASHAGRRRWP